MISETLYRLRIEHGYTQQQVADEIGIERVVYGRYENGQRTPVVENIVKLAKFYNTSTDYLLGLTDEAGVAEPLDATAPSLLPEEEELLGIYRELDREGKIILLGRAYEERRAANQRQEKRHDVG